MKLTTFLLLLSVISVFASKTYSQTKVLNLKMKNSTVKEVLRNIEEQSEFYFMYSERLVDVQRKVSVNIKNKKIDEVLDQLFAQTNVEHTVKDRFILLTTPEVSGHDLTVLQQTTIAGKVTDKAGMALPGVTILIKGTMNGTVTNADGNYNITNVPANATLVFSFIGMKSQEVVVADQTTINVVLKTDVIGLDEVVTIGYGTAKKSDLTGSITRVNVEDKIDLANTSILQAIQGEVAGVNVGIVDRVGGDPILSMRGQNSLGASNYPLIVLDGIIYSGSIIDININDIQSIDALKDASAAAVYGSRAANGVLIITSKKGKTEKPLFSFTTNQGFNTIAKNIEMMNGEQYQQSILDYRSASGLESDPSKIDQYLNYKEVEVKNSGTDTDWLDATTRTGYTQEYQLSVSGVTKRTNYYMSGAYNKQEGVILGDDFNRYTFRINLENKITDWFTVKVNTFYAQRDYSGYTANLTDAYYASPLGRFWLDNIVGGDYDPKPHDDYMGNHPLLDNLVIEDNKLRNLNVTLSGIVDIPFIPGLKYTLNYNSSYRWGKTNTFWPIETSIGKSKNGRARRTFDEGKTWTMDNIFNYENKFGTNHTVNATFLYSRTNSTGENSLMTGDGITDKTLGYNKISLAETQIIESGAYEENSVAYMGRVNYKFKNRYMATFTYRRDGFSGFGVNKKYGDFPSMAFGWVASEEGFMKNVSWLDYLKVRASYGKNGNQAVGRYTTMAKIGSVKYLFGDSGSTAFGSYVSGMANADLGWESTTATNFGLDFAILNNRLSGDINYYNSETYDLILNRNLPRATGFSSVKTNLGKIHNHGVEVALSSINVKGSDFTWTSGITFSINRNEIKSLYGHDLDGDGVEDDDIGSRWFIGKSLGAIYNYTTNGIYQLNEDIPFDGYTPGMVRLVDIAGLDEDGNVIMEPDGEITPDDRSIIGYSVPNYRFSITNDFKYKNFVLHVFINSIQGGGKENYYMGSNSRMNNPNAWFPSRLNMPVAIDYWTPDNPSNKYPIINYKMRREHGFYEDRSFVRLQDVSLSYTFNKQALHKYNMDNIRIYLSGKNLYTWTKWTGFDPESGSSLGGFPMLRSYVLGLNIKF